jgi:uncharacterized protein YggE
MEPKPHAGVKVFGSAVLRVEPDLASLQFAVYRRAKKPRDAFHETHQAVKAVRAYLGKAVEGEVAMSRIALYPISDYVSGRLQPSGYSAKVSFNILLSNLDSMEDLLVGVVDAGANEIGSVEFRTTRLKEHRAEARRRAIAAAREKAEIYCKAAGISLGPVISLEDVNPSYIRGISEGTTSSEAPSDDSGPDHALAPGNIVVSAAVTIVFAIGSPVSAPLA